MLMLIFFVLNLYGGVVRKNIWCLNLEKCKKILKPTIFFQLSVVSDHYYFGAEFRKMHHTLINLLLPHNLEAGNQNFYEGYLEDLILYLIYNIIN